MSSLQEIDNPQNFSFHVFQTLGVTDTNPTYSLIRILVSVRFSPPETKETIRNWETGRPKNPCFLETSCEHTLWEPKELTENLSTRKLWAIQPSRVTETPRPYPRYTALITLHFNTRLSDYFKFVSNLLLTASCLKLQVEEKEPSLAEDQ